MSGEESVDGEFAGEGGALEGVFSRGQGREVVEGDFFGFAGFEIDPLSVGFVEEGEFDLGESRVVGGFDGGDGGEWFGGEFEIGAGGGDEIKVGIAEGEG